MGVEVRPLGVRCNIQCQYCYQNPERDAGNEERTYDIALMKTAIDHEGGPFSLFGGEPLLVPEDDLEDLFHWGHDHFGGSAIQTNGSLLNDRHLDMFARYNVNVGVSVDGPGELNDARWAGSLAATRERTARTMAAIERLCAADLVPSLIVTLHRGNASAERLPVLIDWIGEMAAAGITSIRLHLLEVDSPVVRLKYALSAEENLAALLAFLRLESGLPAVRFDLFQDMRAMLVGMDDRNTCVWTGCDPYTTRAVRGVEGDGRRTNCGRTNKEGIDFVKADRPGFERYLALYQTPQDAGGCQGCRFFLMCKGQCPGTALDGDWRNRTEHCAVWTSLYERLEGEFLRRGLVPLSRHPIRPRLEAAFMAVWSRGGTPSMSGMLRFGADARDGEAHATPAV
ncbi:hypothetical protein Skr01_59440 [Sphaerisporangium krabiense]|uniref:Radical SAM core domain-containing protein n=1 Tax=Sphaerisporangium krabiense TaxID=763782 RepID=A0A7W8ZBK4_9ACTN|nr:radical SAM protein [Sphaerisporangium krabiense]MBB5630977.1 uncharacterized protein [Sphaerisporangium krabiense]GII65859.1 hypothetical protein Skr01_59440 [Sphaerisporangium krabiense]